MKKLSLAIFIAFAFTQPVLGEPLPNGRGEVSVQTIRNDEFLVTVRGNTRMTRTEVRLEAIKFAAKRAVSANQEWFFVRNATAARIDLNRVAPLETIDRNQVGGRDTSANSGGFNGPSASGGATMGADAGAVGVGTQASNAALERRAPRRAHQTTLHIQTGNGDGVELRGLKKAPEFLDAKSIAEAPAS